MTCFEDETKGNLVQGLEFHKFYMENGKVVVNRTEIITAPKRIHKTWDSILEHGQTKKKKI